MEDLTEAELADLEVALAGGDETLDNETSRRVIKALRLWNRRAHQMLKEGLDLASGLNKSALKLEDAGSDYKRKYEAAVQNVTCGQERELHLIKRFEEATAKVKALELQIDLLKKALYEECRGIACTRSTDVVGYRYCTGCEERAKKAYGEGWGK